ncbi:MAG: 4-hydroxythreonine-4-phosphate dehydrogenase PdxA [Muribaculaceae bacterium]|nr:4-hydroxythreonine-4-phosphate dehydrogenase PdxA [Muribaculaceae bacterium]
MMDYPIRVGITHGDVNGVGYEVILKAVGEEGVAELFTPVIFGISSIANKAKEQFGLQNLRLNVANDWSGVKDGMVNLFEIKGEVPELQPGQIDKVSGKSAVKALEEAVIALKNGDIDVLVTAPISKEAVQSDAFKFPGHTEFLTDRIGEGKEAMMILCNDSLRVALLTVHVPVTKIAENITEDKIVEAVEKFASTLKKDFGIVRPTIAVLSLNPHAGDGGLLGKEEEEIIKPALNKLIQNGILAFGPYPADGFFGHGSYKKFDGVLAMYHDQGLAPFKTIASSGGVNFSADLPFVRTSPDHGTAFDIAWKGEADPASMRDAIYMAIDIFRRRKTYEEASANPLKKYVHERPERGDRHDRFQFKNDLTTETDD